MFDRSAEAFPIKRRGIFLNSCGVSPIIKCSADRATEILNSQRDSGLEMWRQWGQEEARFRQVFGAMLKASPENIAFVQNTSEGLNYLANGYPFQPGDEIVSYLHEFPSNHYPWRLQERRGVKLKLLPDRALGSGLADGRPRAWAMEDLEKLVTSRTRVVAISHVQFTSGFAADLKVLGGFCAARGIDLVVDAAQSLGVLPLDVKEAKIAAVAASGWKWLLGPCGAGVLFTSAELRKKLSITMAGPYLMEQGDDYLNHAWKPLGDARMFEYSTLPLCLVGALASAGEEIALRYGIEKVSAEARRLRGLLRDGLKQLPLEAANFGEAHESGILSFATRADPAEIARNLASAGLICSSRGGYLRFAPHFFNTDEEIQRALEIISAIKLS